MSHGLVEIGFPQLSAVDFGCAADSAAAAPPRSFLAGEENRLAVVALAALAAAGSSDVDGKMPPLRVAFNPLVLHGPSGVGKSHLALTLACEFQRLQPGARVLHVCGADFARDYADAIDRRTMDPFRQGYRSAAMLVLDGLDALLEKPGAQQELLWTLDEVLDVGGRIVMVASRAPGELSGLLPALRDRLGGGLSVPVALPGYAARLALLQRFAATKEINLPEAAAEVLAEGIVAAAPILCGAVMTLALEQREAGGVLDVAAARHFVAQHGSAPRPVIREIAQRTARQFGLTLAQLKSPVRLRKIAVARSMAMYLCRQFTDQSLERIGDYFGGRDHTTVLHSIRRAEELLETDPAALAAFSALRRRFTEQR